MLEAAGVKSIGDWKNLWLAAQEWNPNNKVTKPYSQISNVYKAVKAIADNVPQAELKFMEKTRSNEPDKEVYPDQLIDLFNQPNPLMDQASFIQAVVGFYALAGETFIIKQASVGQRTGARKLPAELWTFNPRKFREVTEGRHLKGWRFGGQLYTPEEVLHSRDFNPYHNIRGMNPVHPIQKHIDIDWQSMIYNKAFFDNDATPGFMLETDKKLGDEQYNRLQTWWKKRQRGASKAYKLAILEGGLKAANVTKSHKEMDFIEQKKFTREEILGIWRAPKALFNITDDLNYATFVGQMKIFWQYSIMPILMKVEAMLNAGIIREFDDRIYCKFALERVPAFQEDMKNKTEVAKELVEMGFTANEVNDKLQLGFEPKPWRDHHFISINEVPADQMIGENALTDTDEDEKAAIERSELRQIAQRSDTDTPERDLGEDLGAHHETFRKVQLQAFLKQHDNIERPMASKISRYYYEQRVAMLQAVDDAFPGQKMAENKKLELKIDFNWFRAKKEWRQLMFPFLSQAGKAGDDLASELTDTDLNEDIMRARRQALISQRTEKSVNIIDAHRERVNRRITEALERGENLQSTIDEIKEFVKDGVKAEYNKAQARARVIARTEVTAALNGSKQLRYEQSGANHKQWVTSRDDRVRDLHTRMDKEVVRMSKRFSNGLEFPGGDGSAQQVINCRCTHVPVFRK